MERVRSRWGRPASDTSRGKVICRSTSSGPSAGTTALTVTCLFVTSGTASIGSCVALHTPRPTSRTVMSRTAKRFSMEKRRRRSIIVLPQPALQRLGLDDESVLRHDRLAGFEPGADLHQPIEPLADLHVA